MASSERSHDAGPGPGLTEDLFLGGRLRLRQPARGYRAGTDAMLLAAAVPARGGQSALDLGCGAGAAILALGTRVWGLTLAGLEVQADYADLARGNAALNGLGLDVHEGSVEAPPGALAGAAFDHVLMNPPFFDRAASVRARDAGRDIAHGGPAPLAAWLDLAARRLRAGGWLTMVHRVAALPEALTRLPSSMGSVEVLPIASHRGDAPSTIILRARKWGRAPFRLASALVLHDGLGGGYAAAVERVLRGGGALAWSGLPINQASATSG